MEILSVSATFGCALLRTDFLDLLASLLRLSGDLDSVEVAIGQDVQCHPSDLQ